VGEMEEVSGQPRRLSMSPSAPESKVTEGAPPAPLLGTSYWWCESPKSTLGGEEWLLRGCKGQGMIDRVSGLHVLSRGKGHPAHPSVQGGRKCLDFDEQNRQL
jgi:hypothetical protein